MTELFFQFSEPRIGDLKRNFSDNSNKAQSRLGWEAKKGNSYRAKSTIDCLSNLNEKEYLSYITVKADFTVLEIRN